MIIFYEPLVFHIYWLHDKSLAFLPLYFIDYNLLLILFGFTCGDSKGQLLSQTKCKSWKVPWIIIAF